MTSMPINPFLHYSNQLQALFVKASNQKNPAMWLYQNDARTVLFMLEGLTHLHQEAFEDTLFQKWNIRFKKLEDALGCIDYYFMFEKEFKTNKKIPKKIVDVFFNNYQKHSEILNKRLKDKKWLEGKLFLFNIKIDKYVIIYDDEYITDLKNAITSEIKRIKTFALTLNYSFTDIESEVHEMRRKLRWISIYAHALNGLIQTKTLTKKPHYSINYETKEILKSPFNKLPVKPKNTSIIEFNKDSFLALSWTINELGRLKEAGLKTHALANALMLSDKLNEQQATEKAIGMLGVKKETEQLILKEASDIIYKFIVKDKILDTLIIKN